MIFGKAAKRRASGAALALATFGGPSLAQAPELAAGDPAALLPTGRAMFTEVGCGACHALADAGASGRVGPSLDGNTSLSEAYVADRVANGKGMMPAFGGQLSPEEIAALSAYVVKAAAK